jgi:hypothetical protein
MPITKPPKEHIYNTKTVKIHKNKTLNKQNKNNGAGKSDKKVL